MSVNQDCLRCLNRPDCVMGQVDTELNPLIRSALQDQIRLLPGDVLLHPGMPFDRLYLVRYGHFKSVLLDLDGRSHTTGLHGRGDVLGLEGLDPGQHHSEVTALQHASVCVFRYASWCELVARIPSLQQAWFKTLSRTTRHDGQHMLLLGSMDGQERMASFLLMLWQRSGGARTDSLDLMMTRQEIGNYLGMTLESVSRHLSQFQRRGWIRLERRRVQVLNLTALQQLKTADETSSPAQRSLFQRRMGMTEQSLSRV
jgi:CRP/FNR family transcriptional regulator